jgi:5-methylcytosine-specific restriction enzyme B
VDGPGGFVRLCTFHPGYGYEDFIEGLRPKTVNGQMVFEPRDGLFKLICHDARERSHLPFYLLIDEINRGDVPRIFGELLTILELDKRAYSVILPTTGRAFSLPDNIFLIGTMNTADRSISLLDAALRRRFGFVELLPDSTLLAKVNAGRIPLGPWLDALNTRIRKHLKRDARNLQVGHAYLMSPQLVTSFAEFARILRDEIIPLLEEYCYDDYSTLADILGNEVVDVSATRIRDELFLPKHEENLIQACLFEELQDFVTEQGLSTDDVAEDADASIDSESDA